MINQRELADLYQHAISVYLATDPTASENDIRDIYINPNGSLGVNEFKDGDRGCYDLDPVDFTIPISEVKAKHTACRREQTAKAEEAKKLTAIKQQEAKYKRELADYRRLQTKFGFLN